MQGHIYREKQTDGSDRQENGGSGGVMRADRKCKMRGVLNGKRRVFRFHHQKKQERF